MASYSFIFVQEVLSNHSSFLNAIMEHQTIRSSPTEASTTILPANRNIRDVIMSQAHVSDSSCCLNGGICILGTFCHCRKNFYGRHCEHRIRRRSCGDLEHHQILRDACNVCQCYDGVLLCQVTLDEDCSVMELGYDTSVLNFRKGKTPALPVGIKSLVAAANGSGITYFSSYVLIFGLIMLWTLTNYQL